MESLARILIVVGLVIAAGGVLLWAGSKLGLGSLPGDLSFSGKGFKLYIPIGTSIVISVILTVVLNLLSRSR